MTPALSEAEDGAHTAVYVDVLQKYLAHLRADGCSEAAIRAVNAVLQANCRLLTEDEYPLEEVDDDLKREVAAQQQELHDKDALLAAQRGRWDELAASIRAAARVDVPNTNDSLPDDERPAALDADLVADVKRWCGGKLAERGEAVREALAATRQRAARLHAAVEMQQNASAAAAAGGNSKTPDHTIQVTPPGTPESRARDAFAKRGLTLPAISPNVTPRKRRVRRKLDIS